MVLSTAPASQRGVGFCCPNLLRVICWVYTSLLLYQPANSSCVTPLNARGVQAAVLETRGKEYKYPREKKAACEGALSAALKQQSPAEAMELRQLIPAGDPSRSAWISFGCNGFWYRLYHSLRLPVPLISVFCFTNTSDLSGLCSPESQGDFSS